MRIFCNSKSKKFDRLYHVHVRKCGGTSVNSVFLRHVTGDPACYAKLSQAPEHRIVYEAAIVVGWNKRLIECGDYDYAFSHIPYHSLALPDRTYTFSMLRDPIQRVVSHYSMIVELIKKGSDHPLLKTEAAWAEGGFEKFIECLPRQHLQNQLFMYDPQFRVGQALDALASITTVRMLQNFSSLLGAVNTEFGTNLEPVHVRKSVSPYDPSREEALKLESRLAEELCFLERAKKMGLLG